MTESMELRYCHRTWCSVTSCLLLLGFLPLGLGVLLVVGVLGVCSVGLISVALGLVLLLLGLKIILHFCLLGVALVVASGRLLACAVFLVGENYFRTESLVLGDGGWRGRCVGVHNFVELVDVLPVLGVVGHRYILLALILLFCGFLVDLTAYFSLASHPICVFAV